MMLLQYARAMQHRSLKQLCSNTRQVKLFMVCCSLVLGFDLSMWQALHIWVFFSMMLSEHARATPHTESHIALSQH